MLSLRTHSISFFTLALLAAGCSSEPANAPSTESAPVTSETAATEGQTAKAVAPQSAEPKTQEEWRIAMSKSAPPKDGCFEAVPPSMVWTEVPCTVAPAVPHLPAKDVVIKTIGVGTGTQTAGGGADESAQVSGTISWAQGSFPIVTGVTSAGNYSLQINTNNFNFNGALCNGATNCRYWEQFVYDSPSSSLYIQYWLINATTCPSSAWRHVDGTATTAGGCYINSAATSIPSQPITNLYNLALTGQSGSSDTITMWAGDGVLRAHSQASVLGLNGGGWNTAEFNIFGDSGGDQVNFNNGAWVVVQTLTNSVAPTTAAPSCITAGTTAETNNLTVVPSSCCAVGGVAPGICFTESNIAGATAEPCPDTTALPPGGALAASNQFGLPDNTDLFAIDNGGALTVTWAAPGAWAEPVRITGTGLFPAGTPIATSQQFGLAQTDVFAVDDNGFLDVMWVGGASGWQGPMRIGTSVFPRGAHIATSQQFGLTQTDVFAVDTSGALTVNWVSGGGAWHSAEITGQHLFPPGAPLVASQQFGLNQTDVFLVNNVGKLEVVWAPGGGNWAGPALVGNGGNFAPGTYVGASNQFGLASNTDVFAVDLNGNLNVAWVNGANAFQGPVALSSGSLFPAGAPVVASQQFGVSGGQTDVFVMTGRGQLDVMWVDGGASWNGPATIASGLPGNAQIATSQQFGLGPQTDVFVVNGSGNRTVTWASSGNAWSGPSQLP